MQRRQFLASAALSAAAQAPVPIIDTHIHLFDPSRKDGIPWPPKDDKVLYKAALPPRYREVTKGLGIVGAIEVEASPWLEDNQWVLDVAQKDTMLVGFVGDLEPGKPAFAKQLERFHKNPLFRGIRYGNIWDRDLGAEVAKPEFVAGLKLLAQAGLTLDSANPDQRLIEAILKVSDAVPNLKIIIDHLPNMPIPKEASAYRRTVQELAKRPDVFVKVSAVLQRKEGKVSTKLADYKPRLDDIFDTFGIDRLVYGSDWPHSDLVGEYRQVLGIVKEYFATKGRAAEEKYFWRNSTKAYGWVKRDPSQPKA